MRFKTTSKEIKEFVLSVSRAVDIKPPNPSLQGIYLRVADSFCELIGTDLDLVIKAKFPVEEMVEGESLINSRVFSEVVRKLPVGDVVFSDLGNEVKIETKKTEYKLRKLDHLTYPKSLLEDPYNTETSQKLKTFEVINVITNKSLSS